MNVRWVARSERDNRGLGGAGPCWARRRSTASERQRAMRECECVSVSEAIPERSSSTILLEFLGEELAE